MNYNYYAPDANNGICEANGCTARATTQLSVRVGDLGNILLSLCSNCVTRFADEDMSLSYKKDT
jgi:hypothetical protein